MDALTKLASKQHLTVKLAEEAKKKSGKSIDLPMALGALLGGGAGAYFRHPYIGAMMGSALTTDTPKHRGDHLFPALGMLLGSATSAEIARRAMAKKVGHGVASRFSRGTLERLAMRYPTKPLGALMLAGMLGGAAAGGHAVERGKR